MHPRTDVSPLLVKDRWARVLVAPPAKPPSMRLFGVIMLGGFGILGGLLLWGWSRDGGSWRLYGGSLLVSLGVLIFLWSVVSPATLGPVYRGWMAFGMKLGTIVSSILLTVAYFLVVTPVGLLMRLTGTDPLDRAVHREARTYWHPHAGPRPPSDYEHMS